MNFFKRRSRSTTVSVLDDTEDDIERNKIRRSSGALKRSAGVSSGNGYHDSETKLFEEPLFTDSQQIRIFKHASSINSSMTGVESTENPAVHPEVIITAPSESSSYTMSGGNQINENNNSYNLSPNTIPEQATPAVTEDEPYKDSPISDAPDQTKAQEMMTLYGAIIRGEKSTVKKLLTTYPELLEAPDNFGRTPLMYCVLSDRLDCAKLLLKMKCKLDQVDKAGRSALHLAAHKASYKFLELLHERGGNIEMKDNDGQTPLHLTTRNRHARCLDFLLRRLSPGMAEVTDNQNRTALHWSAAFNNAEYVKLLIKYNCNTAISDVEGKTPLHWAANTHDPSSVATMKALLDCSPSALNWQDYEGRTALHFAVAHENVAAVEYLLCFKQDRCEVDRLDNTFRTPLHWAAQLGNANIVKLLLSVGAKNSISDGNGATPLLYAALHNNPEVVNEMIKHDPNILDQADIEGRTALMWASGKGANDVIQMLLRMGSAGGTNKDETPGTDGGANTSKHVKEKLKEAIMVDVNRTDNKGNTALHMASWNGCARSAELLLIYNARHDLQNNMNHTPLFGACEKGTLSVVKHLLDYNASITLHDLEERSPLHWAALGGHAEVCDLLIKKGLDPDIRDGYQRSPLHCAAFGGFINCMNLLLENKANVDLQDQEGMSALHWAAQSGHLDASKLLFQCSAFPNLMEFTEERLTPLDHALLNGRDEVAQYLIEQGALSSETIRDIAAARIQACYRGYQVRKAFFPRKNLLMKHDEMLRNRNKKDKNRRKRKTFTSSLDHLNNVGEEPVPKSPNADSAIADSLYSGDESRPDVFEENPANVKTIVSPLRLLVNINPSDDKDNGGLECEENNNDVTSGERYEDEGIGPSVKSSVFTAHISSKSPPSLTHVFDKYSEVASHPRVQEDAEVTCTVPCVEKAASVYNSLENISNLNDDLPNEVENSVSKFNTEKAETANEFPVTDESPNSEKTLDATVTMTPDAVTNTQNSDTNVHGKRKKKKKPRPAKSNQGTVSSDKTSTESERDQETESPNPKEQTKIRKTFKSKHLNPEIYLVDKDSLGSEKTVVSVSLTSENDGDSKKSVKNKNDSSKIKTSPALSTDIKSVKQKTIEKVPVTVKRKYKNVKSNIVKVGVDAIPGDAQRDIDNIGRDEDISLDRVRGLAYNTSEVSDDISMHSSVDEGLNASAQISSDLSLSEYIESLMSLSTPERKVLVTLQRNRKHAFKRANVSAKLIQRAWRRYLKQKYPDRRFEKLKIAPPAPKRIVPTTSGSPPDSRSQSAKNKAVSPKTSGSAKSLTRERPNKNKNEAAKNSKPDRYVEHKPEKSSAKKQRRRPHTSHMPSEVYEPALSQETSDHNDVMRGSALSDVTSETGSNFNSAKPKRVRPKTEQGVHRRHRLVLTAHDDTLSDKLQQLCKVYGQTLVLHEMYTPEKKTSPSKSRFKTVTAPSVRPKTSRALAHAEFEDFEFDDPRLQDPVTAVQSFSSTDWKSSSSRNRSGHSSMQRRHSKPTSIPTTITKKRHQLKRNQHFNESDIAFLPLQWQKMYGDLKMSSILNPNQKASAPTRFSYNMRSANL